MATLQHGAWRVNGSNVGHQRRYIGGKWSKENHPVRLYETLNRSTWQEIIGHNIQFLAACVHGACRTRWEVQHVVTSLMVYLSHARKQRCR